MEDTLAILFVDVCDSTRLFGAVGDVRATEIIGGELLRLDEVTVREGGRVVKSLGDGLMCVFPTANQAVAAAEAMTSPAFRPDAHAGWEGGIHLRVGIHFGSVVKGADGDVFGDTIIVARRVESLASPDEILLTDEVLAQVSPAIRERAHLLDRTTVKGKGVPIGLHKLRQPVAFDDATERTLIGFDTIGKVKARQALILTYYGQRLVVGLDRPKVMIGRSETCDIAIRSRQASRQHGSIEFSRESFVLTDHSSNGTFVRTEDGGSIALLRDSARLVASGLLGFGAVPERDGEEHVVAFQSVGET